jgi:serine/threonine-protein kinase
MPKLEVPDPLDPRVGLVIGQHYLLRRVIARGVGSAVYEAENVVTRRRAAIKILDIEAPRSARRRMVREALAIARLTHRHIVRVEDVGVDADGSLFLVQELLEGPTLADIIAQRGFLSLEEAIAIIAPVLDALAHAHDHGIVHRDVKPSNIVVACSHENVVVPVLIDFGIAARLDVAHEPVEATGSLWGTPPYMAPEQFADPTRIDPSADVWGAAMSLHEAITGTLPLRAHSIPEFALEVRDFDSFGETFLPGVRANVRAALGRALRVAQKERTAGVRELARDLDDALAASRADARHPTHAPPPLAGVPSAPEGECSALALAIVVSATDVDPVRVQDELQRLLGSDASVMRMRTYEELVDALESGEADMAWLPPVACAHALARGAGRLVAALDRAGGIEYRCALVGTTAVRDYRAMRGCRAAWVDRWSAAGYLMPRAMMRCAGLDPDRVLVSQTFAGTHANVMDALRAGTADVGGTFWNRSLDGLLLPCLLDDEPDLVVIDVSEPIPADALCASPRLSIAQVGELRRLLLDPKRGRALASTLGAASLRTPDPSAYRTLVVALDVDELVLT